MIKPTANTRLCALATVLLPHLLFRFATANAPANETCRVAVRQCP